MRVAIVYPSFGVVAKVNQPNIKAVADNYGIYPNTSLAYLAAALDEAGHDLIFLDGMASGYSLSDMVKKIKLFKPEIMMFTITTYLYWETLEMIKYFKKNFSAKIIVGGAHLGLYPKETLKNDIIDFGIIGEGEITKKLNIEGVLISTSAKAAIEKAGGTVK